MSGGKCNAIHNFPGGLKQALVLIETVVFRVEILEIGALCYKIVQKWVIRCYTRAAAVQE